MEIDFHVGEKGYATVELVTDFMKIRELFTGTEMSTVIKTVKKFCEAKNADLINKLRYEGQIEYDGVVITKEFCAVKLIPVTLTGTCADDYGLLVLFDLQQNEQLKYKAVERELFSKVQQLRKAAKLQLSDRRNVQVSVFGGKQIVLDVVKIIAERINGDVVVVDGAGEKPEEELLEIDDVAFVVALVE